MNAINSLWHPASEANHNVRALLGSTEEVVERTKTFCRWFQLWRAEARHGWTILGRFKVRVVMSSGTPCLLLHMGVQRCNQACALLLAASHHKAQCYTLMQTCWREGNGLNASFVS